MTISFRLDYTVRELTLAPNANYVFQYAGPHDLKVILRPPSAEEQQAGHRSNNAFCVASSLLEANAAIAEVFVQIATSEMLSADAGDDSTSMRYLGPDGSQIRIPKLSVFPEVFRTFLKEVRDELSDYARRTVSTFRWRVNHEGLHDPISTRGLHWSIDNKFWHPAPTELNVRARLIGPVRSHPSVSMDVAQIVAAGQGAPLYHDLFREAYVGEPDPVAKGRQRWPKD